MPLPRPETTPPVTNTYFVARSVVTLSPRDANVARLPDHISAAVWTSVCRRASARRGNERPSPISQGPLTLSVAIVRSAVGASRRSSTSIRSPVGWVQEHALRRDECWDPLPPHERARDVRDRSAGERARGDVERRRAGERRRDEERERRGEEREELKRRPLMEADALDGGRRRRPLAREIEAARDAGDSRGKAEVESPAQPELGHTRSMPNARWRGTRGRPASARARRGARRRPAPRSACASGRRAPSRRGNGGRPGSRSAAGA